MCICLVTYVTLFIKRFVLVSRHVSGPEWFNFSGTFWTSSKFLFVICTNYRTFYLRVSFPIPLIIINSTFYPTPLFNQKLMYFLIMNLPRLAMRLRCLPSCSYSLELYNIFRKSDRFSFLKVVLTFRNFTFHELNKEISGKFYVTFG